jgi:hypothetical protein
MDVHAALTVTHLRTDNLCPHIEITNTLKTDRELLFWPFALQEIIRQITGPGMTVKDTYLVLARLVIHQRTKVQCY